MNQELYRGFGVRFAQGLLCLCALFASSVALTSTAHADIVWSGGTNTVPADTIAPDSRIVITGGTNTVQGAAGPPAGTNAGILQLNSGGAGLEMTGGAVTLNSDATKPGILLLKGNTISHASGTTSLVASGGAATVAGSVNLNSGTRTFTVEPGSVPGSGPDLSIAAMVGNGGMTKLGLGILALSGANTYSGGTTLAAGTLYINSAAAIGTGDLTISGPGTAIDNTSAAAITLANNNQVNLTGGDLNFIGTKDLNLGTGFFVQSGSSSRTVTVTNANATLTIGGVIGDNGEHVGLTKSGPGTLILAGDNLYTGPTNVTNGTLINSGTITGVSVASGATVVNNGTVSGNVVVSGLLTGVGTVNGSLTVNSGGVVDLTGGIFTVNGSITNGGLFILSNGSQLAGVTSFTNNGTLDIITAGSFTPPPNFTDNGVIIDSSVVKTKAVSRAGTTVTVTIDSYTGHTYQLQKSTTSPDTASFANIGSAQQGSTGTVLTFNDSSATGTPRFYRIVVNP